MYTAAQTTMASEQEFVVIDGIIGSGKTTLIEECLLPGLRAEGLSVAVVPEPVQLWKANGSLQQFYDDPKRRGFQFQTRVFHDRVRATQKTYAETPDADIYLLERSIFTDTLFMNMLYKSKTVDESEHRDYLALWAMWKEVMPFTPSSFVHLRPKLTVAMARVKERSRKGEEGVSRGYQDDLQKEHDKFFEKGYVAMGKNRRAPVFQFDSEKNYRSDKAIKKEVVDWVLDAVLQW